MNTFYCTDINNKIALLDEIDSKHAIKVLRLQNGDTIHLVDGKGNLYHGIISNDHHKRTEIQIQSVQENFNGMDFHLHIAVSPVKNLDRFEFFLEKATEIGVSEISIILSDRTIRKKINMDRVQKKVISAMKQCLKAHLPIINEPISFKEFVQQKHHEQLLIAHCEEEDKKSIKKAYQTKSDVLLLIGPEGDFTPNEIQLAAEAGFEAVTLGETRLRNETAGIVGVHSFHMINND